MTPTLPQALVFENVNSLYSIFRMKKKKKKSGESLLVNAGNVGKRKSSSLRCVQRFIMADDDHYVSYAACLLP